MGGIRKTGGTSFLPRQRNSPPPFRKSTLRATGRPLPSLPPFGGNSPSDRCRRGFARSCRGPTSDVSAAFLRRRENTALASGSCRSLCRPHRSTAGKRSSAPRQTHHSHRPCRLHTKSGLPDDRPTGFRSNRPLRASLPNGCPTPQDGLSRFFYGRYAD